MNYIKLFGIAALAIAAILYLASADDHPVVVGEQEYDLGEYSRITVKTKAELKVKVGEDYSLNVTADNKDLEKLKIYVKGKTLVIANRKSMFKEWQGENVTITLSLPLLKKFTLNGHSDATISGLHGDNFKVVVNGSGKVDFSGETDELKAEINGSGALHTVSYVTHESDIEINGSGTADFVGKCHLAEINVNGSGDFKGKAFKCEKVEVDIIGSGDLEVYASKEIDVDVVGSGDVDVYGNPAHVKDHSRKKNHVTVHQ